MHFSSINHSAGMSVFNGVISVRTYLFGILLLASYTQQTCDVCNMLFAEYQTVSEIKNITTAFSSAIFHTS